MKHHSPKLIFEMIFDIAYLLFAFVSGCYLVSTAHSYSSSRFLYGTMTLVLGFGDSFHLIPRIIQAIRNSSKGLEKMLGYGKMITSITMTFFYGILFLIWRKQYPQLKVSMLFSIGKTYRRYPLVYLSKYSIFLNRTFHFHPLWILWNSI